MSLRGSLASGLSFGSEVGKLLFCQNRLDQSEFQPDLPLTPNNFLAPHSQGDLWARTKNDVFILAARETRKYIKWVKNKDKRKEIEGTKEKILVSYA